MPQRLILASSSEIRLRLLRAAGLKVVPYPAHINESAISADLTAKSAAARDIADTLAAAKAAKVSQRFPAALVLGCDQVLDFRHRVWGKPATPAEARVQLQALRGQSHRLLSAIVLIKAGQPVWRHIGEAHLTMRDFSDPWLDGYLARNWESVRHSVGAYKLEEEGVRLFTAVEGDYFTVLGLPLLPLLGYLGQRGLIAT